MLNDEPISIPSSPNFPNFNFGSTDQDDPSFSTNDNESHHEQSSTAPSEPKKPCLVPQKPSNQTNPRCNKPLKMGNNFSESSYRELSKLLDASKAPVDPGHAKMSQIGSNLAQNSYPFSNESMTVYGSPVTPELCSAQGSPAENGLSPASDDTGFRSGSSFSDNATRSCSEPTIVKLKHEETSRSCFETLQRSAQMYKNFYPYRNLSRHDRGLLISHSWVQLFLLSITEEKLDVPLELKNFCNRPNTIPCWRQSICANEVAKIFAEQNNLPTKQSVNSVTAALSKIASVKMSQQEFFYLKAIVLFNPDIAKLQNPQIILRHRAWAEQNLHQICSTPNWAPTKEASAQQQQINAETGIQQDPMRTSKCMSVIPFMREISAQLIGELFFRPVTGPGLEMEDVVMEMFNSKDEQLL